MYFKYALLIGLPDALACLFQDTFDISTSHIAQTQGTSLVLFFLILQVLFYSQLILIFQSENN
jgi:hypothetical protein